MTLTPQRLKRLVKQRERLERLQELELADALRLHTRRAEALNESRSNRQALLAAEHAAGPLDLADLEAGMLYLRRVDREIEARSAALAHSANDVEEERGDLMLRRRDRKAIEALLEKRMEEERLARKRAELRLIDELAVTRWQRPTAGGTA
ncbi:MAG TPA: flagellar export protein FliJ [Tepidiformaceae bacterium]|nr:flagellar export protein FliJ [Tepidiformaceae bacterium]HMO95393.1 flagellar export protein FliJ [Tepidiformaceae bacterium]